MRIKRISTDFLNIFLKFIRVNPHKSVKSVSYSLFFSPRALASTNLPKQYRRRSI